MVGGTFTYIKTLLNNYEDNEITLVYSNHRCGRPKSFFESTIPNKNIKIICKKMKNSVDIFNDIKIGLFLRKIVKKHKYDIIILHATKAGLLGRIFLISSRKKIIYYPHGMIYSYVKNKFLSLVLFYMEKILSLCAQKIVCTSFAEKTRYENDKILTKNNAEVIQHGVKLSKPNISIKKSGDKINIISLSRVSEVKKPFDFIDICKKILNKRNDFIFTWVGDGELMNECRKKCLKDNILKNSVKFVGSTNRPQDYLEKSDIFLSTSIYESFGLSIAEAMSQKNIVIARKIDGIEDLIKHKKTGYFFDSIDQAVELILSIDLNSKTNKEIITNAQNHLNKNFSIEKMLLNTKNLYSSILSRT